MKTLLLTRHAKTIPGESGMSDFDRTLAPRGPKDVKLIARELLSFEYEPDLIISSPAVRAKQTAELFAKGFNYSVSQIKYLNYLYGYFSISDLINDLSKMASKSNTVQIIGHNPSIAEIGSDFSGSFSDALPTSGTLVIEFDVKKWDYVSEGSGVMTQYIIPSALRE
jgi:phosphohistidine phosphatase